MSGLYSDLIALPADPAGEKSSRKAYQLGQVFGRAGLVAGMHRQLGESDIHRLDGYIIVRDIALLYNETQNIDAHSYDGIVLNYGNIVNATVIEINGDTVKGLMNGTASFTVSVNETENYTANSVVVNVTVSPADLELNIDPSYGCL